MSGLLLTSVVLGVCVALLELRTVFSLQPLRRLLGRHPAAGIVMSLATAALLGSLFGAVGVTALLGGVIAVAITWPVYAALRAAGRIRRSVAARHRQLR